MRDHQALQERLSELQRAIVNRQDAYQVLEAVAEAARELIGDELGVVRLVDLDDTSHATIIGVSGADPQRLGEALRQQATEGVGAGAMVERRLVLADAVSGPFPSRWLADLPIAEPTAAMAAPIYERGEVAGSLAVATRRPGRHYEDGDQQALLSLAEHAGLALDHARALEKAAYEALHDSLTALPNRSLFLDRVQLALGRARRTETSVGVVVCDLDGFKTINDSLGPIAGDRLLVAVARRLHDSLRPSDTLARLGGDEFGILLEELSDPSEAARAAARMQTAFESPFQVRDREIFLGVSIGIATGNREPETLLRDADLAMYRAKGADKAYAHFEPQMHTAAVERLELEHDLKRAIEREELFAVYQPILSLQDGSVAGLEALVRWRHPTRGVVLPGRFISLAEESGQIHALGRWVLREACRRGALWRAKYPAHHELEIDVNLSATQLREEDLVSEVAEALRTSELEPSALTLEITETALMEDLAAASTRLEELKELGVCLAMDDFGSGYSSLRYLRRFPLDFLKIDRSFVSEIGSGEELELLRAIVDLGSIFGLRVVAEGIEQPAQRDLLAELGCELGQGNLLSPPLEVAEADSLLLHRGIVGASGAGWRSERDPAPPSPVRRDSGDDED